jgi:hypothetical protein
MNEVKDFAAQKKRMLEYLQEYNATAGEVAARLGIYRPNVCRFKRQLEEEGLLIELGKTKCSITHFPASVLTCDPELIGTGQLKLAI